MFMCVCVSNHQGDIMEMITEVAVMMMVIMIVDICIIDTVELFGSGLSVVIDTVELFGSGLSVVIDLYC